MIISIRIKLLPTEQQYLPVIISFTVNTFECISIDTPLDRKAGDMR